MYRGLTVIGNPYYLVISLWDCEWICITFSVDSFVLFFTVEILPLRAYLFFE